MSNILRSLIIFVMVVMSHLLICALAAGSGETDERLEIPPALDEQTGYYSHGKKYVTEHQPKVYKIIGSKEDAGRGLRLLSFEAATELTMADTKRRVPAGPDPLHHSRDPLHHSNHSNKKNP